MVVGLGDSPTHCHVRMIGAADDDVVYDVHWSKMKRFSGSGCHLDQEWVEMAQRDANAYTIQRIID